MFSCLHLDKTSVLLFKVCFPAFKMQNFSARQRLHCFPPLLYAFARFKIDHLILYFVFASFNSHMYLDSDVLDAYFLLLSDCCSGCEILSWIPLPSCRYKFLFLDFLGIQWPGKSRFVSSTLHQICLLDGACFLFFFYEVSI